MRSTLFLLTALVAGGCSGSSPPAAGGTPTASGSSAPQPSSFFEKLGVNLPGHGFSDATLAAGSSGTSNEGNFGTSGGTCTRTDYNSYRCTAADAGRRMQDLQASFRKLAAECGLTLDPPEAATSDDPLAGFKFHYSKDGNQGDVTVSIRLSENQADARPEHQEVVYTVRVVVKETAWPPKGL